MLASLTIFITLFAQQSVADLNAEFQEKASQFQKEMEQMFETGDFKEIVDPISVYYPKFRQLAKDVNLEASERCQAQLWCMRNFSGVTWENTAEVFDSLSSLFIKEFANTSEAKEAVEIIRNVMTIDKKQKIATLRALATKSKKEDIKAHCLATGALIELDNNNLEDAIIIADVFMKQYAGTEYEPLIKSVLIQRKLQVGNIAPELMGKNVHGEQLSLADNLGKVTYVVFWGFW